MWATKRLLVAEDNVVLGDVLRFNLQRAGFEVTLARNGKEAQRLLSTESFDVLVTDFEMPGMNGEELCNSIRNELGLDKLPIVMCSAKGLEMDREEMITRFSLETILYKPFSVRELTSLLENLVNVDRQELTPAVKT